jgi:hypothetical protein
VKANLVQHPPEINQATNFIVATAQTRDVWHERIIMSRERARSIGARSLNTYNNFILK